MTKKKIYFFEVITKEVIRETWHLRAASREEAIANAKKGLATKDTEFVKSSRSSDPKLIDDISDG